ncbi:amino acid adenylation domain-containing protein [Mucilaginibacter lappiensis]|uniref:Amino acid adenylation domain-containing protein n=1 Tax=Mucilaginibacter lappiensis TaxID=354630 RepID=A0ABR6PS41_9SPHI|nr:condensation domain-containing protein [Mucilaginibacter lappiensis]MBB6112602.1 amino acid adenylation domain-containing protein [Mucilaginibacter lappiensis]SIS05113.1 amino acid adenylation domain-containing protein [Mucilaginibacter lappiensis]
MEEFIVELEQSGLSLSVRNGDLILSGRKGKLTPEEISGIQQDVRIPAFIREHKAALVQYLSSRNKISALYELSPLQEGILFHSLYADNATAYITQFRLDFPDGLNVDAFKLAWQYVISNHSILRTAFIYDKVSIPLQSVYSHVILPFALLDFSELSLEEQQHAFEELLHKDRVQGFNLNKAPLTRVTIVKTGTKACRMIWTKHHILWDGWSGQVIISEVLKAYEQYATGRVPSVVDEDLYQDYIKYINRVDPYKEKQFWEDYLKGFEEPSLLPFVANNSERNKGVGAFKNASLVFDEEFTQQINDYTQRYHITAYTLVQGIWALLLSVYSGKKDVMFGATVSGRPADMKYAKKVGLYINTLPFRAQIEAELPVTEWLLHLQKEHVQAREYQYTSLTNLQKWSGLIGDLFDSILVFRNYPLTDSENGREPFLKITNVEVEENNNYLLSVQASLHQQLIIDFNFNESLLDAGYIEMIKGHLRIVFEQVLREPFLKLSDINVLTKAEERELLYDFNATEKVYPSDKTVVSLFEEQVNIRPDDVAIVFENSQLTYSELNIRADQLALDLKGYGLVGICMERSLDMVVALLAVLKGGAAFIPIDPAYPADRISYVLSDSKANLVISGDGLQPGDTGENVAPGLAYVIYTSGSTGNPKGVMIEHTALVNFLCSMQELLHFTADASVLAVTTFSFDIAYLEIFLPLITGGKVIIASRVEAMDGYLLQDLIDLHRPSHMQATPATWQLLLDSGWKNNEQVVVLSGGEAIKDSLKEALTSLSNRVLNLFGPTETTIWSAVKELHAGEPVLIGKPIHNTQLYIVDEQLRILPKGVKGELCISGDGLARGYLNRPELTVEKFVSSAFSKRLYKTGDLARWLPDGNIEYLDRKDNQVKIRGYRVELMEIENVLQQCLLVSKNAVIAREDAHGIKRLIAYIVPSGNYDREGISEYLKTKLPGYMVPALLVEITELPLTANGKTDRKRLPDPDVMSLTINDYVAPRNNMETRLAKVWTQLLQVERVGVHDNFFELGGHSLLAMRVIAAIRKEMDIEAGLRDLFDHPNVEALALVLSKKDKGLLLPAITLVENKPSRIPLSFSQERLWFIDKLEGSTHYHISAALRLKGTLDVERLIIAFKKIVQRHEVLRTVIRDDNGVAYQLVLPADKWEMSKDEEDINRAFNLLEDYMLRVKLEQLSVDEYRLRVVMHHIAADGWSVSLFIKELLAMYQYVELAPLPLQYADYALWQRKHLVLDKELLYWKEKLHGVSTLNLPLDRPRTMLTGNKGDVFTAQIDGVLSQQLRELAQQEGATVFMLLLSAFKLLLFRYSGDTDICVGTPIANRTQKETEPLIGFFINTLALRTSLEEELTFKELISRVKTTTLDAYMHQDVPFEKVLDVLKPERYLDRSPLFQVFFNMMNQPHEAIMLDGVSIYPEMSHEQESKFDITLYAQETATGISFQCLYNTALFNRKSTEALLTQYVGLLQQIVTVVTLPLNQFSLKTAPWALKPVNADCTISVIDLIAKQVYAHPENVVLEDDTDIYNYKELWEMSSSVAVMLQSKGVGKEDVVAVYGERNALLPVVLLGILKAGACFCILSKTTPGTRNDYYLSVLNAKLVLDISKDFINGFDHSLWVPVAVIADTAAYCVFTSGSTGIPKLVEACHGSLVNYVHWIQEAFNVSVTDHFSMLSGLLHDPLMRDIFVPLCIGGKLMIPSQDLIGSQQLIYWLQKSGITVMNLTPSLVQTLTEPVLLDDLRYVFYGGEPLKGSQAAALKKMAASVMQVCLYGTTESQQALGYYIVKGDEVNLPLGVGLLNTEILVVDVLGNRAGIGELGEIAIRGPFIARGYKDDVLLTNKKFVRAADGVRMYLTGDLGRYNAEGEIYNMGRADNQVKVRGYRIALEEIENVLLKHVPEAVVAIKEGALVAYVVSTMDKKLLKEQLSNELPAYMLPAYIVEIDSIPLTANKKVDRKALPNVNMKHVIKNVHVAAGNEIERLLVKIWEAVLTVDRVGITDNFYELGGNSLKSVQVVARLKNHGFILPVIQILKTPCIKELGRFVKVFKGIDTDSAGGGLTPLSDNQLRYFNGEEYRHVLGSFGIKLKDFDKDKWLNTLKSVYRELDILRMRIFKTPEGLRQIPVNDADPIVEYIRKDELEDKRALPFALEKGEGMRCYVLDHDIVYIMIHHALTDDISNRLISDYLQKTYYGIPVSPLDTKAYKKLINYKPDGLRLKYWNEHLSQGVQPLAKGKNTVKQIRIMGDDYQQIISYCKEQNITISSFMLSLIYLNLGVGTFIVDVIVDGRESELQERAIGQFTNKLPLCISINADMTLSELCKLVHSVHIAGRMHQQVPYAKMNINGKYIAGRFNYRDLHNNRMPEGKLIASVTQEYNISVKCDTYADGILLQISAVGFTIPTYK